MGGYTRCAPVPISVPVPISQGCIVVLLTRLFYFLFGWLFPYRDQQPLSAEQIQRLLPRIPHFDRVAGRLLWMTWLAFTGLATALCCALIGITQYQVVNPVWDHRGGLPMAFPALFAAWPVALLLERVYARRYWGSDLDMYEQYEAARSRINRRKVDKMMTIAFLALATPLSILVWDTGEAIGENGVVFRDGLGGARHYDFSDIASVGRYNKHRAPIGIVDFANLQIGFKDGRSVNIRRSKGQTDAAMLDLLATYVSARSVPLTRGDLP